MAEKFNTNGSGGRDCPICFRAGTLSGSREGSRPTLVCAGNGCYARFVLIYSDGMLPDTLERLPTPEPVRDTFALRGFEPGRRS